MENVYAQWTDDQWSLVQQTVRDEARKVRVAASFLKVKGPSSAHAETATLQTIKTETLPNPQRGEPPTRMTVDDSQTRRYTTVSVYVYLSSTQASQPDLSSAILLFQQAANLIARAEDGLVFRGQQGVDTPPEGDAIQLDRVAITGGAEFRGLLSVATRARQVQRIPPRPPGNVFVQRVSEAIGRLERDGRQPPFALVLGDTLYDVAHSPTESLVMPSNRIISWLKRDDLLLRSSTIPPNQGVLVSLAGDLVDLDVASEISVKFLQVTTEPSHLFRVSQRFTLRVKEPKAILALLPG